MQLTARRIQFGAVLAVGALFTATNLRPQPPTGGPGWHYCSLSSAPNGRASICYASANGCRNEEFQASELRYPTTQDALMTGAAKLGDQGWELVAARDNTLYFKRLKALDNKQPFGR